MWKPRRVSEVGTSHLSAVIGPICRASTKPVKEWLASEKYVRRYRNNVYIIVVSIRYNDIKNGKNYLHAGGIRVPLP